MIEYIRLGNTELRVSRLGFGAEPLGGTDWGQVDEQGARSAVARAVELGVNLFDTADVYGLGRSEQMLFEALGGQRHKVIISTKFGVNWERTSSNGRARTFLDSHPERVVEALEGSLRRLRLDCVPLYFIHWPDPSTPLGDTLMALAKCQKMGKVQHVGVSNFSSAQIQEANGILQIAAVQSPYNLLDRSAEKAILTTCDNLGISVMVYGPLAQGLLTGKYDERSRFDKSDRRHRLKHFSAEQIKGNLRFVDRLRDVSGQTKKTPAQVALRWVLDNPKIACALTGIKTREDIEQNVAALGWSLTGAQYEYLASPVREVSASTTET